MPAIKGFMTPRNHELSDEKTTVGLGKKNVVREVLDHMRVLILDLQQRPTHIQELVPPDLPHLYGYEDSCSMGAGGVWLPCTEWMPPTVWRVAYPADIRRKLEQEKNKGGLTNSDGEMAATLLQYLVLRRLRPLKYLSTCDFADNKATVGWHARFLQAWDMEIGTSGCSLLERRGTAIG
jgi:hypothetical protein